MQRIFWQRLGELVDKQEIAGAGGGSVVTKIERVIVDATIDVSKLSKETLQRILDETKEGRVYDPQAPRRNDQ